MGCINAVYIWIPLEAPLDEYTLSTLHFRGSRTDTKLGFFDDVHVIWLSFHPKIDHSEPTQRHHLRNLLAYSILKCTYSPFRPRIVPKTIHSLHLCRNIGAPMETLSLQCFLLAGFRPLCPAGHLHDQHRHNFVEGEDLSYI